MDLLKIIESGILIGLLTIATKSYKDASYKMSNYNSSCVSKNAFSLDVTLGHQPDYWSCWGYSAATISNFFDLQSGTSKGVSNYRDIVNLAQELRARGQSQPADTITTYLGKKGISSELLSIMCSACISTNKNYPYNNKQIFNALDTCIHSHFSKKDGMTNPPPIAINKGGHWVTILSEIDKDHLLIYDSMRSKKDLNFCE